MSERDKRVPRDRGLWYREEMGQGHGSVTARGPSLVRGWAPDARQEHKRDCAPSEPKLVDMRHTRKPPPPWQTGGAGELGDGGGGGAEQRLHHERVQYLSGGSTPQADISHDLEERMKEFGGPKGLGRKGTRLPTEPQWSPELSLQSQVVPRY